MGLILQSFLWLYGIGLLVSVWVVLRSPEGFEDDKGFHLGREHEE